MSFGDDTLQPESADEREIRRLQREITTLREQDTAIRATCGASELCVARFTDQPCDLPMKHPYHIRYGECANHEFTPESTLSAVQRMAEQAHGAQKAYHSAKLAEIAEYCGLVDDGIGSDGYHFLDKPHRFIRELLDQVMSDEACAGLARGIIAHLRDHSGGSVIESFIIRGYDTLFANVTAIVKQARGKGRA